MASIAYPQQDRAPASDLGFVRLLAIAMALFVVAGFATQLAMGRSTFGSPLRVHAHAVTFMGWVALFLVQTWLGTRGPVALHRRLGWIAAGWMVLMLATAFTVIVTMARNGTVPFFFKPQQFLIDDPGTLLCFVALTGSAIAMRRRTDWHARLHICGMAALIGPAFGRLLPMPLLIPYAFLAAGVPAFAFPIAGAIRDRRVLGQAHPAWGIGIGAMAFTLLATNLIGSSAIGAAVYRAVTAGYPGAQVPGMINPPPPAGPLRTGR